MSHKLSATEKTIRKNACLPASLVKYATKLGGTFSAGSRTALEYHRANAATIQRLVAAFNAWDGNVDIDTERAMRREARALAAERRKAAK